jgi:arylsulfatase A-like enzyme
MPRNIGKSNKTGNAGHFYDTLFELDETVGKIMASLKSHGVDDSTLVLVTGDNGPWEEKCDLTGSAGPYTGLWQKNQVCIYRGVIVHVHVPYHDIRI